MCDPRLSLPSQVIQKPLEATHQRHRKWFFVGVKHLPRQRADHSPPQAELHPSSITPTCAWRRCANSLGWMTPAGHGYAPPCTSCGFRRAYHRIHELILTIAYLAGSDTLQPAHLVEALQYRLRMINGDLCILLTMIMGCLCQWPLFIQHPWFEDR